MERIGFFGGCFNPPTNIHINIANNLIEQGKLDKVVFVPVNDYYKKQDLAEAKHRYNMLKLATKEYASLEVDDIEIKQNKELFAVDAFEIITRDTHRVHGTHRAHSTHHLGKMCKRDTALFLIMGSDNYSKMPKWKDYEKIKGKYNYIVIDRDENEISSTKIREMIKNGDKDVIKYLSKDVYEYIIKNELYKM